MRVPDQSTLRMKLDLKIQHILSSTSSSISLLLQPTYRRARVWLPGWLTYLIRLMLTSLRSHWVRFLTAELQPLTSTNPYYMAANMGRVSINQSPFTWEGLRGNKFTVACNNDGMLSNPMTIGLLTYREKSFYLSQVDSPEPFIPSTGLTCSWTYVRGVNMTKLT